MTPNVSSRLHLVPTLDEISVRIATERATLIEERLRVIVRPKPRWLPNFIWRRLLVRLLYLEHRNG